jgi:hypothetical protein
MFPDFEYVGGVGLSTLAGWCGASVGPKVQREPRKLLRESSSAAEWFVPCRSYLFVVLQINDFFAEQYKGYHLRHSLGRELCSSLF